jgi:hypothetical protein
VGVTPPPPDPSLSLANAASCPVTKPVEAPTDFRANLFGGASAAGNDDLWVGGLGDDGVIVASSRMVAADGMIGWKFGWWRIRRGTLTISGRRLDAEAPPARGEVPEGYGGSGFQASGVDFPTEGCWEVTGSLDGSTLTFVTFVLRERGNG